MREVKLRIYDKLNKVMWNPENIATLDFESKCAWIKQSYKSGHWVYFKNAKILQFTGLHDRNGTEIYEGDVVTDKWKDETYQVIFSDGDDIGSNGGEYSNWVTGFVPAHADGSVDTRGRCEFMYEQMIDGSAEVIGNIHEHSHLLERD